MRTDSRSASSAVRSRSEHCLPIDGSAAPVRLHLDLVGNRDVTEYAISPDGLHVVYLVDHSADERFEVYSVRIDRSETPVRLNDVFNSGRQVRTFEISSDSYHVVFVGDCHSDDVYEIYSVHIRRVSPPVRLNPTLVAGGDVGQYQGDLFAISPDARRVVYVADQETDDHFELFSVSIDGAPAATKLNGPMHANGIVEGFEITANSQRVVFLGNSGGGALYTFYQSQAATAPPGRLTDTAAGDPYDLNGFELHEGDGIVQLATHLGQGKLMLSIIDPSVVITKGLISTMVASRSRNAR